MSDKQGPKEILVEALTRIRNEHGICIAKIDVNWIETTSFQRGRFSNNFNK